MELSAARMPSPFDLHASDDQHGIGFVECDQCFNVADVEGIPKQRMQFGRAVRVHQRQMIHSRADERKTTYPIISGRG